MLRDAAVKQIIQYPIASRSLLRSYKTDNNRRGGLMTIQAIIVPTSISPNSMIVLGLQQRASVGAVSLLA
jgi:hypothetical protein